MVKIRRRDDASGWGRYMQRARDSKGRWWDLVVQQQGSMDCGFACAAMVHYYYHGGRNTLSMEFVKGLSQRQPGSGVNGISHPQNLAHVMNGELKVSAWNAKKLHPQPDNVIGTLKSFVTRETPAVVGLEVSDGVTRHKHFAVAVDFDPKDECMFFLDPYPGVGVVEVWKANGSYAISHTATQWMFDGWVVCSHH